jgi:hypothetical protein
MGECPGSLVSQVLHRARRLKLKHMLRSASGEVTVGHDEASASYFRAREPTSPDRNGRAS